MITPIHVAIGMGSNLGDRHATIEAAVASLHRHAGVDVTAVSSIIETTPVGPVAQGPFLNAALTLTTTLPPRELLAATHEIEVAHGRRRATEVRWGPRPLDLDVLLFGRKVIDEPGLTVPHPRMHQRRFVLAPLAEIAGDWLHPGLGVRIQCLLEALESVPAADLE